MLKNLFSILFEVDTRALGIYRILLGWLCFWDIFRRWDFINIFYTDFGIKTQFAKSSSFSIFNYLGNDATLVYIVFIIGILFSIFLMIGFKTKFSHFIITIIIISIHVSVTKVGNSGDMFMNCILIWTLFLPLGKSISIDSLILSLKNHKENNLDELNDRTHGINRPIQIYSLAYFAMLFQISAIYFFTALDKHGHDWMYGKAFYKMLQLDGFITTIGHSIRDYITYPISKFFTFSTLYLEYSVPFLLFIPFYNYIFRLILALSLTIFHLSIRLTMNVGLFSQIMITTFPLLLNKKIFEKIKKYVQSKHSQNRFILFYDSDCGFCHYTVRIIKRLDIYNLISFDHGHSKNNIKPKNFDNLSEKTAMLYEVNSNKLWIRHQAFGKIITLLPLGKLISWIFFIPYFSELFGKIYDQIAINRTKISIFFGLPACNLPNINEPFNVKITKNTTKFINIKKEFKSLVKILSPIILLIMLSSAVNSALIENPGVQSFLVRNNFIDKKNNHSNHQKKNISISKNYFNWDNKKILKKISTYPRMIQMWKMFSPNVLSKDNLIVVEAFLNDGSTVNPFTGQKPVLDNTDFTVVMKNKSQLWRKYFENFNSVDARHAGSKSFKNWILNPNNTYFGNKLDYKKLDSVKIWKITQLSPSIVLDKQQMFKKIRLPKEVTKDCLTCKKIYKNSYKKNQNNLFRNPKEEDNFKEKLPQNLEEYMKLAREKNNN